VVLTDGDTLDVDEFPQIAAQAQNADAVTATDQPPEEYSAEIEQPLRFVEEAPLLKTDVSPPPAADERELLPMVNASGDLRPLADLEADVIRFAIAHCRGRMSEVARRLGIGRSTLYRKLEGMGLIGTARASAHDSMPQS
jgi:DNA-binding NtrC family response regulator